MIDEQYWSLFRELEIHIELIRLNVVQTKRIEHPSQIDDFSDELTDVVKSISIAKSKWEFSFNLVDRKYSTVWCDKVKI